MTDTATQFLSPEKKIELEMELQEIRNNKIPALARRIDDARQLGDLSENAEYHSAREDMSWARSREKQIVAILESASVVQSHGKRTIVGIGSTVTVVSNGKKRVFTIVGAQEADPMKGKISNESPMGQAFFGHNVGKKVSVTAPSGVLEYTIENID